MTVTMGGTIGPFEIVGLLGAGGMGAVYRAHDTRLKRTVAIKVLPPDLASDSDRQRRFEQEALAVARLNHPNILAVHDIGVHDGSPYLVTELLDGRTLRERMNGKPLSERKAVEYAIQIAHGLAAAHHAGVVHRDLKPDNLFVTADGRVKILDFGLAKLSQLEGSGELTAETVTVLGIGPVIGTAAYMSPEQARGHRADHRSDVFSFGVVLYEMLSGVSPFARDTSIDTVSAVLHTDPFERQTLADCDPALSRLVQHCLEKEPADRFQSVRDLLFTLEGLGHAPARTAAPGTVAGVTAGRAGLAAAALIAAAAVGYLVSSGNRTAIVAPLPVGVTRLTDFIGIEEFPAVSPDGKSVAFTGTLGGRRQIFVRLVAGGAPLQITRDAIDHEAPRWSPDSSSLVFFSPAVPGASQGTIWEVPALGGAPRRIVDSLGAADLSSDGRLAYFRLADKHVELMSALRDGSDLRVIHRAETPTYHRYPRWSPDRRWIAYQRGDGVRYDVFVVPADGGVPRQVTRDNAQIRGVAWLPDSSGLVYATSRGSTVPYLPTIGLWEMRLDGRTPVRRVSPPESSYVHPDVNATGTTAAARIQMQFDLWKFPFGTDARANVQRAERITRQTGQVQTPTVGPGDREIAFLSDSGGHANFWVIDTATRELRQITYERDPEVALGVPVWSPDGRAIAFVSSRGNTGFGFGVWVVDPDGGNLRQLAKSGLGPAWSPDGQWVYFADAGDMYKVAAAGGVPARIGRARNVIGSDGSTLYFMVEGALVDGQPEFEVHAATPEDGPSRVLVRFPASRVPPWQIVNPALSPDGRWLALPLTDAFTTNVWAVSTATGEWRQITDFGDRATFIARRVSWSSDSGSVVAAVGEGDADIVLFHPQ